MYRSRRYISLSGPLLILRPPTEWPICCHLWTNIVRKKAPEKKMRKNLRALDIKKLEGGFGGMHTKIDPFFPPRNFCIGLILQKDSHHLLGPLVD